jgi:hypothetical protein
MDGGGTAKAKAIRKGQLEKGETASDMNTMMGLVRLLSRRRVALELAR